MGLVSWICDVTRLAAVTSNRRYLGRIIRFTNHQFGNVPHQVPAYADSTCKIETEGMAYSPRGTWGMLILTRNLVLWIWNTTIARRTKAGDKGVKKRRKSLEVKPRAGIQELIGRGEKIQGHF